jgi:Cytochrome c oxidase assembly protein PET191
MSKSCQGLLQEFVRCLLNSDCVKVQKLLLSFRCIAPIVNVSTSMQKHHQCLQAPYDVDVVDDMAGDCMHVSNLRTGRRPCTHATLPSDGQN